MGSGRVARPRHWCTRSPPPDQEQVPLPTGAPEGGTRTLSPVPKATPVTSSFLMQIVSTQWVCRNSFGEAMYQYSWSPFTFENRFSPPIPPNNSLDRLPAFGFNFCRRAYSFALFHAFVVSPRRPVAKAGDQLAAQFAAGVPPSIRTRSSGSSCLYLVHCSTLLGGWCCISDLRPPGEISGLVLRKYFGMVIH